MTVKVVKNTAEEVMGCQEVTLDLKKTIDMRLVASPRKNYKQIKKELERVTGIQNITAVYVDGREIMSDTIFGKNLHLPRGKDCLYVVCCGEEYDQQKWGAPTGFVLF